MAAYLSILIPVVIAILLYLFYNKQVTWWELLIPIGAGIITIVLYKYTAERIVTNDTEYRGSLITQAQYYEYWETWKHRTCSYTVSCGKNCSHPVYYDCSYCDHNDPYWKVIDNYGNEWRIPAAYFKELALRWKATPQFHELNRSIEYHGGCGEDGNMYSVAWDNQIASSEPATKEHSYQNKVQASHSAFKLPYIKKQEAKKLGLYDYPAVTGYHQEGILGIEQIYSGDSLALIRRYYQYLNGYCGYKHHCRIYVLLFVDKSLQTAFNQRAYWDGGNDNELVVCVGLNKQKQMQWVNCFTWCDNKRVDVEIRENLMEHAEFNPINSAGIISEAVKSYFKPKNFLDFDYLKVDMPMGALVLLYLIVVAISCGVSYWCIKNDFENE